MRDSTERPAAPAEPTPGTLGTFAGVFTPSVLTILGIILFLRLGYVVGAGGLSRALAIVLLANVLSVLTSISLSAIATNLKVKAGGDYYLISRTLGVGFGGALGLVLFLSQAVSIAFYALGFGEALAAVLGDAAWPAQAIAFLAVAALFVLAWLGADWATRFQYVVMAVLFSAIGAFFVGAARGWEAGLLRQNFTPGADVPFWALFAIFFPAVTGFTQGVSMSGDLRTPSRSIPTGTFLAVGLSFVVYVGVALAFAGALPADVLAADYSAMRRVSALAWLTDAGVVAATLSSALASFLGAPRILQSLAADRLFPFLRPFAKGAGPTNNPRRGVLLAAAIAFGTVAVGNLDLIAPVVSMFFLISYALLNFATFAEARSRSPFFRPRFRFFDERLSLLGALGCLGAMVALNPGAAAIALALLAAIYMYLERAGGVERWADNSRSVLFQRVRGSLERLSAELAHPRDWRPVILVFSEDEARRERLLRFADWIEGDAGITTAVQVLEGTDALARSRREEAERVLRGQIRAMGLHAFPLAVAARDLASAAPVLLQAHGLGSIRPNTAIINWFDAGDDVPEEARRAYGRYLRSALALGCNVIVLHARIDSFGRIEAQPAGERRIDVVYRDDATGRLSLLFAYLMTRDAPWEDAHVRLLVPPVEGTDRSDLETSVRAMLTDVRIPADVELIDAVDPEAMARYAADTSVVFMPLAIRDEQPASPFSGGLDALADAPAVTAFCLAARDVVLDAQPESGVHGALAAAEDAAQQAEARVKKSDAAAAEARGVVETARTRLEQARAAEAEPDEIARLERDLASAEAAAEQAARRASKDVAKAEQAGREAEAARAEATGESAATEPDATDESP